SRNRDMTEADWLASNKVLTPLMNWLRHRGSSRRFYLAAAGWVRQVEHALSGKRYQNLVDLVERFADSQANIHELSRAHREADNDLFQRVMQSARLGADAAAVRAATPDDGWIAAINTLKDAGRIGKRAEVGPRQMALLRDIFGNPFRPTTLDPRW